LVFFGIATPQGNIRCLFQETTDAEIQELFQLMDVNKDQKLAPKELDCVLRALGINATEADLIEFIGERESFVRELGFLKLTIKEDGRGALVWTGDLSALSITTVQQCKQRTGTGVHHLQHKKKKRISRKFIGVKFLGMNFRRKLSRNRFHLID
jgi:hypothetical protein